MLEAKPKDIPKDQVPPLRHDQPLSLLPPLSLLSTLSRYPRFCLPRCRYRIPRFDLLLILGLGEEGGNENVDFFVGGGVDYCDNLVHQLGVESRVQIDGAVGEKVTEPGWSKMPLQARQQTAQAVQN